MMNKIFLDGLYCIRFQYIIFVNLFVFLDLFYSAPVSYTCTGISLITTELFWHVHVARGLSLRAGTGNAFYGRVSLIFPDATCMGEIT